jgi:hypothetical protein
LGSRCPGIFKQQAQQRDGALPKHGRLGAAVENGRLGVEAERAELVQVAPNCHSTLLANFWERIHDFRTQTADLAQALAGASS